MTEENKINILNYLLGGIEPTSSDNSEIFLEQEDIPLEAWQSFLPNGWNDFRFEGMVAPNEKTTSLGVLYGGYIDMNNNVCGIIVLVDQNFTPVQTIYEYDSGTKLRYIQCMKQAEDGTFYFIDDTAFTFVQKQEATTSQKRFVMVNNFTLTNTGTYSIHLRTSYILSGDYVNFYCKNMYKDPNSSHYILFGSGATATGSETLTFRQLKIWSLKINVGSANEWTMYANENHRVYGSAIATFEGDNVRYRCLTTNNLTSSKDLVLFSKTYTGSPTSSVMLTFSYKPYIDDLQYPKQSVFLDYDNVYFVQNNQRWGRSGTPAPKYIGLYKYNIANSQLTTIYEKSLGNYDFCNIEAIYIDRCNTDIYVQYNNNITSNETKADYYFQRLVNNTWSPILIAEQKGFIRNQRSLFIKANYNLLQIYLYQVNPQFRYWFFHTIKEDYNALNYNGIPYTDYDSTISHKGEIYSDNKIVFARNLYDKTSYQNTTTSTIQIPSSYLNDIVLTPKNLMSVNNNTINSDTTELTKNIYENVLLNFVNSIHVIDEDTGETYPEASTYINTNLNVGTQVNQEGSMLGKVRLNYEDGSLTQTIVWEDISTDNLIAKQTSFSVYVSSPIVSVDFLNYDETFIYLTKNYDFEIGKTYTMSQKIRIE